MSTDLLTQHECHATRYFRELRAISLRWVRQVGLTGLTHNRRLRMKATFAISKGDAWKQRFRTDDDSYGGYFTAPFEAV